MQSVAAMLTHFCKKCYYKCPGDIYNIFIEKKSAKNLSSGENPQTNKNALVKDRQRESIFKTTLLLMLLSIKMSITQNELKNICCNIFYL